VKITLEKSIVISGRGFPGQELRDETWAAVEFDCEGRPLEGKIHYRCG
jgi:hypothetical protein